MLRFDALELERAAAPLQLAHEHKRVALAVLDDQDTQLSAHEAVSESQDVAGGCSFRTSQ